MNSPTQKLFMPGSRQKRPIRRVCGCKFSRMWIRRLSHFRERISFSFFKEQCYTDRENRTTANRTDGHASCSSYSPTHHTDYSGHVLVKETNTNRLDQNSKTTKRFHCEQSYRDHAIDIGLWFAILPYIQKPNRFTDEFKPFESSSLWAHVPRWLC